MKKAKKTKLAAVAPAPKQEEPKPNTHILVQVEDAKAIYEKLGQLPALSVIKLLAALETAPGVIVTKNENQNQTPTA